MRCRQTIVRWLGSFMLLIWIVGIILIPQPTALASSRRSPQVADVVEVSPPEAIQKLRSEIDQYQPQVKILSPAADQLLKDDTVSVRLEVKDLPVFKDATLGLGPHIHVFLDNQPYQEVYELSQPLIFKDLSPGTHTLRAVASRPWFESFKNPGAYAQVTFHVFTQTEENNPTNNLPLLTYGQPQGQIGAETVLLDFYLSNLNSLAANSSSRNPKNWQALVSINGSSFYIDEWEPLYIQGLKPGKNWVRMELTDRQGRKIDNAFNDTIRVIDVQDNSNDTLSRLIRGDLAAIDAGGIVDPNYKSPPVIKPPVPQPSPTPKPEEPPITSSKTEKPKPDIIPAPVLKQPDRVLAPAAPVSPTPSKPQSSKAPAKLPPTEPNKSQTKSGDPSAQKSIKTPTQSKVDERSVPKATNGIPSSSIQQPKPSQAKSTEKQTAEPTETKLSPVKSPGSNGPVEKDRDSSSTTSIPREQTPSKPSGPEDKQPQKTTKTATPSPAAKSTQTTTALPQSSSESIEPKTGKQKSAPAIIPKESTNKKSAGEETAITAPPKHDKLVGEDEDSPIKTTITNFWDKIRPAQETTTPSTATPKAVEKKETEAQAKSKTSQGASSVPDKISPPKSTTPYPTSTKSSKPQPKTPSTSKTPSPSTSTNRPPSSVSGPMTDKNQSKKGQEALIKENLESAKTQAKPPAVTPTQPETSVFSSLRSRWQQQKQQLSKPEQESTARTTPSTAAPKTTDKTNVLKPAPNSNLRGQTSPTKTSITPKVTDKTSTTVQKTPSLNADEKGATKPSMPSVPADKPKPTESVFSSLRDRWQQQKQIVAPPAKPQTTSTKAVAPKTTNKPSTVKPIPSSGVKQKIAPSTATPKVTEKTSTTVTKTPSQNPDEEATKPSMPSVSKDKPKPTESVFSSLRERWQQQKQIVAPPAKPQTTSTKAIAPKTTNKPSTKPTPSSNSKKETAPARTSAPKITGNTSPTVNKTPSQNSNEKATQPSSSSITDKPKPTESVFSSLRDRWQQQKQIVAPPAKPQTTSTKAVSPKAGDKSSTVKPIPNNGVKKEIAPSTATPKVTEKTSPTVTKTPSQNAGEKEGTKPPSFSTVDKPKPAESVFSSLRDRWQQQRQIAAPPAKQQTTSNKSAPSKTEKKPTTTQQQATKSPAKTVPTRSTGQTTPPKSTSKQSQTKPSTSKSSGFSSLRDRWQQQKKQLSPSTQQQKAPARTQSPAPKTTPNQAIKTSPGKSDINLENKANQSQPDKEKSEPMTFDPGVFYRRLLSKDETSSPKIQSQPKRVSPTPSS